MKDDVEKMKKRIKSILIPFMLLATLLLVTACSGDASPYGDRDDAGYNISVKYDANGGTFTTGMSVMVDSYKVDKLEKNSAGNYELGLLDPNDEARGSSDAFEASKPGYFLAGWYTERIEQLDSTGNTYYTYSGRWNFASDILEVDASKEYTASEPVVTLYAAWVPMFQVNFYNLDGQQIGDAYSFNPISTPEIAAPAWKDGAMVMQRFPKLENKTYVASYYDQAKTQPVGAAIQINPEELIDFATGTAKNTTLSVYVEYREGDWFRIETAQQFIKNAKASGNYELVNDLDFTGEVWPSQLVGNTFTGKIVSADGQPKKMSHISANQNNNSAFSSGIFGSLGDTAVLENITFEDVTFVIKAGARVTDASFGLLAGTASAKATVTNVNIVGSKLQINADSVYFQSLDTVTFGKVFGSGYTGQIALDGITVEKIGEKADKLDDFEIDQAADRNDFHLIYAS